MKLSPKTIIFLNLVATFVLTYSLTRFSSVDQVLSAHSWGAGTPSGNSITAFATMRPWWLKHRPEPVVETASGGIQHVVEIPRASIHTKPSRKKMILPHRSLGYDAILGGVTALRSAFSDSVIYDFALFVRLQQLFLVLALTLIPVTFSLACPGFRTHQTFTIFNVLYLLLLFIKPNKNEFLTEGIIDSSLANSCAMLSISAVFLLIRSLGLKSRKDYLWLMASSLFCSFCTQVRGEFLAVFLVLYGFLLALIWLQDKSQLRGVVLSLILLFAFPMAHGLVNQVVFGRFIPLRLQYGQNLFEPIGQYPNPYGIKWNDDWVVTYLQSEGFEYGSFEADDFLLKKYFDYLCENPMLFVTNFSRRLSFFSQQFRYPFNFVTLIIAGVVALRASWKDRRFLVVAQPLFLAFGYLVYFGWTNLLLRCVTPVHFLLNVFWCLLLVYLMQTGTLRRLAESIKTLVTWQKERCHLKFLSSPGIWLCRVED